MWPPSAPVTARAVWSSVGWKDIFPPAGRLRGDAGGFSVFVRPLFRVDKVEDVNVFSCP